METPVVPDWLLLEMDAEWSHAATPAGVTRVRISAVLAWQRLLAPRLRLAAGFVEIRTRLQM